MKKINMKINQRMLAERLSVVASISQHKAMKTIKMVFDIVLKELSLGNNVSLKNIGTLNVYKKNQRAGVIPKTKQPIIIPEKMHIKLILFKKLSAYMKNLPVKTEV